MPRKFRTIGGDSEHTVLFAPVRETIVVGGRETIQTREIPRARLSDTPTTISDEQAEALRRHRLYGSAFAEVTGAEEAAETAASKLETPPQDPGLVTPPLPGAEEDESDPRIVEHRPAETLIERDYLAKKEEKEGGSEKGDSEDGGSGEEGDDSEDELEAAESVTDVNSAVQFLTGKGADAEDLQDKNGNLHAGKIRSAARDLGYTFPNY